MRGMGTNVTVTTVPRPRAPGTRRPDAEAVNDRARLVRHRLVARRMRDVPGILERARENAKAMGATPEGAAWRRILAGSAARVADEVRAKTQEMDRLRIASPLTAADPLLRDATIRTRVRAAARRILERAMAPKPPLAPGPGDGTLPRSLRSMADLDAAVRRIGEHFDTPAVIVFGSQAILVGWEDAPADFRVTPEIDLLPANAASWNDASLAGGGLTHDDEIDGLFGEGTPFEERFGFYVDGVDRTTAVLPEDWPSRAVFRTMGPVTAVAPSPEDLIVSKLYAGRDKDRAYIRDYARLRGLDVVRVAMLVRKVSVDETRVRATLALLHDLVPAGARVESPVPFEPPPHPEGTHCAFVSPADGTVEVRRWDPVLELYFALDNPIGPARVTAGGSETYALEGTEVTPDEWMDRTVEWDEAPDVPRPPW